jgi:hypothetical protein
VSSFIDTMSVDEDVDFIGTAFTTKLFWELVHVGTDFTTELIWVLADGKEKDGKYTNIMISKKINGK